MRFTHENRAARILEIKNKYSSATQNTKLQALDSFMAMSRTFEQQYDLGLIEWDTLASLRVQSNASVAGLIELLHEAGEFDLAACKVWKRHHPYVWMFIDEPRFITETVHKQFLELYGDITRKNPLLKSLAQQLSRHNWDISSHDKLAQRAQHDSLKSIEDLSAQLKLNKLAREVEILWDYYAPPAAGKTPSYSWLIDYIPPTVESELVVESYSPPPAAVEIESPPENFFEGLDNVADASAITTSPGSLLTNDMLDGPDYSEEDLDLLAGM